MRIRMTFDIPKEANRWLENHSNSKGTRRDWRATIDSLVTAFLEDIAADYENKDN